MKSNRKKATDDGENGGRQKEEIGVQAFERQPVLYRVENSGSSFLAVVDVCVDFLFEPSTNKEDSEEEKSESNRMLDISTEDIGSFLDPPGRIAILLFP